MDERSEVCLLYTTVSTLKGKPFTEKEDDVLWDSEGKSQEKNMKINL